MPDINRIKNRGDGTLVGIDENGNEVPVDIDAINAREGSFSSIITTTQSVDQSASNIFASTNTSISPSTFTKIALDASDFDHLNAYDSANNQFVVDAGQYAVSASARFNNSESGIRVILQIRQNGTDVFRADSHAAVGQIISAVGSTTIDAADGDVIELYGWHNGSSSMDNRAGSNETSMQINRVG